MVILWSEFDSRLSPLLIKYMEMIKMTKLKLGIPNGSMVDPKRGGLSYLLEKAGIYIDNLGKNKPLEINIPWIEAREARPQEFPALANMGYCDAYFCGDDWAKDWDLAGIESKKILGLDIGKVDIVVAVRTDILGTVIYASEYPNIALNYLKSVDNITQLGIKSTDRVWLSDRKDKAQLFPSIGKTELKAYYKLVDGVIEASQTGETLKNYGLVVEKVLMSSECSLYSKKELDKSKKEKLYNLKNMLEKVK
ncbi:hypothetical protein GF361_05610 [Candidatus Woesearchaeota archaeon]|nr:hypothetical protein [Candidatus Woesearchaeota archaeon]